MVALKKENRALVVDWCKSVGVDASKIHQDGAVLYRHDDLVCFQFREFALDDEGHRQLCHGCGECGCGGDHYKMRDREVRDLPIPDFYPDDQPALNLGLFARGFGY